MKITHNSTTAVSPRILIAHNLIFFQVFLSANRIVFNQLKRQADQL
jgi:hypothetical protein